MENSMWCDADTDYVQQDHILVHNKLEIFKN